ncbi:hypothetical protein C8J57DRAFT_1517701 [Mycena rebaudengoi]|nr:hypothetical protein C8J57DRAFT_1517701 [Mycena rebaudengoi]
MSTSTPPYASPAIRAITTSLVTRAASPIPCAEALYVPLAQRVRLTTALPPHAHNLPVHFPLFPLTHTSAPSPLLLLQNSFATAALRARTLRTLQAYTLLHAQCARVLHAALCTQTMLAALYALRAAYPPALLALLLLPAPALPLALLLLALLGLVLRWSPLFPLPLPLPLPLPRRLLGRTPVLARGLQIQIQDALALANAKTMTIALQSHLHRCARAGAVVVQLPCPRRGHAFCLSHTHTPQTRFFLHPKVLIASGAGCVRAFRGAASQCGGMALVHSSYTNRRAFFLRLARYGLRRARLVASWRGVGHFVGRLWRETTLLPAPRDVGPARHGVRHGTTWGAFRAARRDDIDSYLLLLGPSVVRRRWVAVSSDPGPRCRPTLRRGGPGSARCDWGDLARRRGAWGTRGARDGLISERTRPLGIFRRRCCWCRRVGERGGGVAEAHRGPSRAAPPLRRVPETRVGIRSISGC